MQKTACFRALKARLGSKESKKAKKLIAQGIALGKDVKEDSRPERAKAFLYQMLLPLL